MEAKLKYLEFIQNIITRMANNSFKLKGWAVTISAGVSVLMINNPSCLGLMIVVIPILSFFCLDGYYLQQERLYRALYEKARKTSLEDIDFSLKATIGDFADVSNKYINALFSKTEISFYAPTLIVFVAIFLFSA